MKKIIVLTLVLVLLVGLAACRPSTGDATQGPTKTTAATKAPASPPPQIEEEREVHFLHWRAFEESEGDNMVEDYVAEQIGIRPICINNSGADLLPLLLNSKSERLDVFVGSWQMNKAENTIIPLNDLFEQYGQELYKCYAAEEWLTRTDADGKIWQIPVAAGVDGTFDGLYIMVREDYLDKVNLEVPKTMEEFEAMLDAFATSDALPDNVIPLMTCMAAEYYFKCFAGWFIPTGMYEFIDTDGSVKPPCFHPGYQDFLKMMNRWYEKGYLPKETFLTLADVYEMNKTIAEDRVGAFAGWESTVGSGVIDLINAGVDVNYINLGECPGPAGNPLSRATPADNGYLITAKSEDPEAAMILFNWQYSNSTNAATFYFGLPDFHWKWTDEENRLYETLEVEAGKVYNGKFSYVQGGGPVRDIWSSNDSSTAVWRDMFRDPRTADKQLTSTLKVPDTLGMVYDWTAIMAAVPAYTDLYKYKEEQAALFITGQRDFSTFDAFIQELYDVGFDKTIAETTRQYNEWKGQ